MPKLPSEVCSQPRPLIVGECNPYGGGDEFALYPAPDGCSGHRLCCLILQMRRSTYLGRFVRCNLVQGTWKMSTARLRADEIQQRRPMPRVVLLGSKVAAAWDVPFVPFEISEGGTVLVLPHPSGLCRLWNEDGAMLRARAAVSELCPELAEYIGVVHSLGSGR